MQEDIVEGRDDVHNIEGRDDAGYYRSEDVEIRTL